MTTVSMATKMTRQNKYILDTDDITTCVETVCFLDIATVNTLVF
jgi:hypothetical protein